MLSRCKSRSRKCLNDDYVRGQGWKYTFIELPYLFPSSSHTYFTIGVQLKAPGLFFSQVSISWRFPSTGSEAMMLPNASQAERNWWMVGPLPRSTSVSPFKQPGGKEGQVQRASSRARERPKPRRAALGVPSPSLNNNPVRQGILCYHIMKPCQ